MVNPEPSLLSPFFTELQFKPTADGAPEPTATNKPSPRKASVLRISPEPEPQSASVQVRGLVARHTIVEVSVGSEGAEECPAHCTTARGELRRRFQDVNIYADMPPLLPAFV